MSVYIIGEIGSNHCNDITIAKKLIKEAAYAGCNAVKFQAFDVDRIWTTKEAADERRKFEVTPEFLSECAEFCRAQCVDFLCTPFSPQWVKLLDGLVSRWKVASAHVWDRELLDAILQTEKPIILSMGAIADDRVQDALTRIRSRALGRNINPPLITPLCCVSKYPAAPEDYSLKRFLVRANLRGASWGISDHTIGIGTAIAAVALGATVVEKHIALYQQPKSPDDGAHAIRPGALRALVAGIRQAEAACGIIKGTGRSPSQFPSGRKVWR